MNIKGSELVVGDLVTLEEGMGGGKGDVAEVM